MAFDALIVTRWGTRFMGRRFPSVVGRGGITGEKREGDGATPAGVLHIAGLLFRPDRVLKTALPCWAEPILPGDLWSDDPRDAAYNHAVHEGNTCLRSPINQNNPDSDFVSPCVSAGAASSYSRFALLAVLTTLVRYFLNFVTSEEDCCDDPPMPCFKLC